MMGNTRFQDQVTEVAKAQESDIVCRVLRDNETLLFDVATLADEDPAVHFEVDGEVHIHMYIYVYIYM